MPRSEKHQIQADALQSRNCRAEAGQQVWGAHPAGEEQAAFAKQILCKSTSILSKGRQVLFLFAEGGIETLFCCHLSPDVCRAELAQSWGETWSQRPVVEQPGLRPAHSVCQDEGLIELDMVLRSYSLRSFMKKGLKAMVLCIYIRDWKPVG